MDEKHEHHDDPRDVESTPASPGSAETPATAGSAGDTGLQGERRRAQRLARWVGALVEHSRTRLGEREDWAVPVGHPLSLALCIIDAIYSTGSHPTSVANVVEKYTARHGREDGAKALSYSILSAGGAVRWAAEVVENRKPANTHPGAPLKARVVEMAAQLMIGLDIDTVSDLREAVVRSPLDNPVRAKWLELPSQSSGVTYGHLLIMAGLPAPVPDRMVVRFVAEALDGVDDARVRVDPASDLDRETVTELVSRAAAELEVGTHDLEHLMWQSAMRRRSARAESAEASSPAEAVTGGDVDRAGCGDAETGATSDAADDGEVSTSMMTRQTYALAAGSSSGDYGL